MKHLAAFALAIAALCPSLAFARRVIMRPSIISECRSGSSWNQVETCVRRFGNVKILKSTSELRLISVGAGDELEVSGRYLFAQHDKRWLLSGIVGRDYMIDNVSTTTIQGHKVHRLDVSLVHREEIVLGDGLPRATWFSERIVMLCATGNMSCESIVLACDFAIRGKSIARFRGTLAPGTNGELRVDGDRSLTGEFCTQDERVLLPVVLE